MHPQLDRVRFDTCESLMDALEECHRQEFLKQALGLCNFEKDELANVFIIRGSTMPTNGSKEVESARRSTRSVVVSGKRRCMEKTII